LTTPARRSGSWRGNYFEHDGRLLRVVLLERAEQPFDQRLVCIPVRGAKLPCEYAFWPGDLDAVYGLLLCEDDEGNHWTLRGDPDLVRMIRDSPPSVRAGLTAGGTWDEREGWPDEWADLEFLK
jgi:hypothetical protein